jgi:hypothetical protein
MNIAYSYGRFSSAAQEFGHSRKRQSDSAVQWCAANGYVLSDRKFFDKGKSGYYGENFKEDGALRQFIKLHEEGEVEKNAVLIIDSVDRFSRLPVNISGHHFLSVINAGIGLVFSGSNDKRVITGELIAKEEWLLHSIIGELKRAHGESSEKSRKVKASLNEKKSEMQSGLVLNHNNVPKYFKFIPKERHGKGWKGVYIKHPEYAPLVVELVEGILAGRSMYEMGVDLNKRNIPTFRRGFQWHRNSIRQILKNRTLIGEYLGVPNYVEPIVDEQTFLKVQNVLNQNTYNRGKRATLVNFLRGVCFCAECGRRMHALSKEYKGTVYRYLRCSNYGLRESCTKAFLRLEEVEKDFLQNFLSNPYRLINQSDVSELNRVRAEIAAKIARQNQVKTEIDKVVAILETVSMEEVKAKLTQLNTEREKLKNEIDALNALAATIQDVPSQLEDTLKELAILQMAEGAEEEDINRRVDADAKLLRENYVIDFLNDNPARERLKVLLPSVVGKVIVNGKQRQYSVLNRTGRLVYESPVFESLNNNTDKWRESLKGWTERKTAGGRIIKCKRYQNKYYDYVNHRDLTTSKARKVERLGAK